MKIEKYKTVCGKDLATLDQRVNELMLQGFEPYGQQYYAAWDDTSVDSDAFIQPMVKKAYVS